MWPHLIGTPIGNAYAEMQPRIEAERVLDLTSSLLYALRRMTQADSAKWIASLHARARGDRPKPKRATERDLAEIGIPVERVEITKET